MEIHVFHMCVRAHYDTTVCKLQNLIISPKISLNEEEPDSKNMVVALFLEYTNVGVYILELLQKK